MPLHLLGKKSWNVYNPENIARVRRDEAEARAHDAEQEDRSRDNDAADRLAHLRYTKGSGETLSGDRSHTAEGSRKRRRLAGEDDTDRDIRLARRSHHDAVSLSNESTLIDQRGHIDIVSRDSRGAVPSRGGEGVQDENSKPGGLGVRLADAGGRKSGSGKPWYSSNVADGVYAHDAVSKDVWGNEDPGRLQRERQRMDANDPLAAMKKGVKQLRETEARRKEWMEQRERDLHEVEELATKRRKHRRRGRDSDEESLDDFDLDNGYREHRDRDGKRKSERKQSHHHHRSRRRDRSKSPRKDRK